MKKTHLLILCTLFLLLIGITNRSQAQLTAGDLAIVYFTGADAGPNCTHDDTVSILTLVPLAAGEKFILTDQSMHDNNGANPEEFCLNASAADGKAFVYTAPAAIPAFSLIVFNACALGPNWADYTTLPGNTSTYFRPFLPGSGAEFDLNPFEGDQLFLFIDSNPSNATEPAAEPLFIFGMDFTGNFGTGDGWNNNVPASNTLQYISIEPLGLINAGASLELANTPNGFGSSSAAYYGPLTFTSKADALTKITTASNWLEGDPYVHPNGNFPAIAAQSATFHNGSNPFSGPSTGPTAACQNQTVPLNASGSASIAPSDLDGGSTGGQTPYTFSASKSSFSCSDVGANTVSLTVTDANNETSSCSATVTITDVTPPTAICQNRTVQLDINGNGSVNATLINNGSADVCSGTNLTFNPSSFSFNCNQVGQNPVTLSVSDASNNSSSCSATVTVQDNIAPTVTCANTTASLDANGNASINAGNVLSSVNDNCPNHTLSVSPQTFTCNDIGSPIQVTLTVTDASGLTGYCTANVTVVDAGAPHAVCQSLTVPLDGTGNASIAPSDLDGGSSDNCGIASYSASATTFDCSDVGNQTVALNVIDGSGNFTGCNATVTVQNNHAPSAVCQNYTLNLPGTTGTINPADVDGGSAGVCAPITLSASPSAFSCNDLGPNSVVLTVSHNGGNGLSSTCTATVTVQDPNSYCCAPPAAVCNNITVNLNPTSYTMAPSEIDDGSTADCGLQSLSASRSTFDCTDVGNQTVTLTITDINNASSSCTATVTVVDNTPPVITLTGADPVHICQYETYTDAGASYSDNCSGTGPVVGNTSGVNTSQAGTYTVTYNHSDPSGNAATQITRTVIVDPAPAKLAEDGCNNCDKILVDICQDDPAPNLQTVVQGNANYENGATLNWYEDNNGVKGNPLPGAPTVNSAQTSNDTYWVEQQLGNCPGPAILLQLRVRRRYTPDFNLPAIGCGNTGRIDLAAWVSDPKNKATAYTFYDVDPVANPGATPLGTVNAKNGVVCFGEHVLVTLAKGSQTIWVQSTVPNGCGGTASSTLVAPAQAASLNPISNIVVNHGAAVNVAFTGQNATHIFWFNLPVFNNPYIGILGTAGLGNLSFTAYNTGSSPLTATIRVIPYNGNCAGTFQDFTITVNPSSGPIRQGQGNNLQLAVSRLNAHDALLSWDILYEYELNRFEIEKKRNDGEFESIGFQDWKGNGSYEFTDKSAMGNENQYRLKLVLADGRIVWSEIVELNLDYSENRRFNLYPNPGADQFHVKALFPIETSFSWQLSDVMGKVVKTGEMTQQETTIQIHELAAGTYHLVMTSPEGKRYLMKVVKQ